MAEKDERIDYWKFGFTCAIAAIVESLDAIIDEEGENDEAIFALLQKKRTKEHQERAKQILAILKQGAPLFRDLLLEGRLPLGEAQQEVYEKAHQALLIGIEATMSLEEN